MQQEKISIIVPIYNVEKYLERCLDSIINQTYKNLEIILVDDGSKDNCYSICEDYRKKDNRIVTIHKENGGLSDARNIGLLKSTSNLICFIDSDDYIDILYKNLIEFKADISVCGFSHEKEGMKSKYEKKEYTETYDSQKALKKMIDLKANFSVCAWNKLYKKKLFDNIKYPKGCIYEDVATTYKVIDRANKIVYTSKSLYNYCFNEKSITKTEEFNDREMVRIKHANEMCEYIIKRYPSLENEYVAYQISQYIAVINVMLKCGKDEVIMIEKIKKFAKENCSKALQSSLKLEKKIQIFIFCYMFNFYKFLFRITH